MPPDTAAYAPDSGPPPEKCANCEAVLVGPFCAQCGQKEHELRPPFGHLFGEILEEVIHVDSKLPHTLWLLVSRPGFLTREYFAGRRARYIGPFKIYLLCSVLFFVGMAAFRWARNPPVRSAKQTDVATLGKKAGKAASTSESKSTIRIDLSKKEPKGALSRLMWRALKPKVAHTTPQEIGNEIARGIFDYMPDAMLVLLPIFALILRVLYWRRYYVEHFVFALHLHAVGYLGLLLSLLVAGSIYPLVVLAALAVYIVIAFRRFYAQGWLKTVLKLGISAFVYITLIGFTVAGVALAGVVFSA